MSRDLHFEKHGHKVGAVDAAHYERMADAFMFEVMNHNTRECRRPNKGDRLRFDTFNRRFAAEAPGPPPYLRTFYRVEQWIINAHGDETHYFA